MLVWLYATGLWTPEAWQIPSTYVIDALHALARLKFSGEAGLGFLFDKTLPELGAPWGADWSAYPMPDAPFFILFGKIGRVIGLIPAGNLALLFTHLSAVAVFYLCSRALGHRAIFAGGAALLFGFSFYVSHRGLSHSSFALAYLVPAQLLSVWLIGGGNGMLGLPRWRIFCLATAMVTGVSNPYFGFGYGQLLALAMVYQAATTRRRRNLTLGVGCLAVFVATFALLNYSALLDLLGDHAVLLERNFAGTEVYGFRPIELLIPPIYHRWSVAAEIGARYAAVTSLKGELFYPYLGLAGAGGLLVIAAETTRRLIRGQVGLRPAYAATVLWITAFFMVGGLNSLLAFAGFDLFRAGNRYSIYLLAVALMALTSWASHRGRRLGPWTAFAVMVPVVLICLGDQLPRPRPRGEIISLREKIAGDRRLAHCLGTKLPPGAAVFQLPAVPFLEQPPVNRMTDYELFRPWLFSEHTRFSYGLLAGEKGWLWQKWTASRPADLMCAALEKAGFAALYIHKAAFPDSGTALRQQLAALGKTLLFDEGDHVVYALHPVDLPQLPDLNDARLAPHWNGMPEGEDQLQLYASAGWFELEHLGEQSWRWAGDAATVTVWCPEGKPLTGTVEFTAVTLQKTGLSATLAGREIWHVMAGHPPAEEVKLALLMQPGANRITFHYDGVSARASLTDPRRLGFRLCNLRANFAVRP